MKTGICSLESAEKFVVYIEITFTLLDHCWAH